MIPVPIDKPRFWPVETNPEQLFWSLGEIVDKGTSTLSDEGKPKPTPYISRQGNRLMKPVSGVNRLRIKRHPPIAITNPSVMVYLWPVFIAIFGAI